METRDIVLSLLIVLVGVGIFYLLDPTMAGLLNKQNEGFSTFPDSEPASVMSTEEAEAPGVGTAQMLHTSGNEQQESVVGNEHNVMNNNNNNNNNNIEGFDTLTPAPMPFKDAEKPANCYPKDQINPQELLPNDPNSKWAQVNPMGQGDIAGKNYLSAGALIGVNTIGQSMRNANYQLRSDPPNPQVKVSIWNQSTIEPDINRRSLEIG
jgi:hypothetical protein